MSPTRRYFEPDENRGYQGPSDEMLAVDAASELRSLTLLYERYADRLYRYFLLCTGDPDTTDRLMRDLIYRLPGDLQRFGGQDRSFAGWLFARASEVYWREFSIPSRIYRRVSRFIPGRSPGEQTDDQIPSAEASALSGFDEISTALRALTPDQREVLGIHIGAALRTAPAAEALRLPASLMSSNVEWALTSLGEQLDVANTTRLSEELSELIDRQSVSSEQRRGHFALIHGLFYGEVDLEPEESDRKPVMEIGVLIGVVLVGLVGIWAWGLVTPGDPQHPAEEPPPIAGEQPAETPPTLTPAPTEPEPTVEPTPDSTPPPAFASVEEPDPSGVVCLAAEGKSQFDRFVRTFNDGDFELLSTMLPGDDPESEAVPSNGEFFIHGAITLDDREEITAFLMDRYDDGERWDVMEAYPAEHYRNWQGAAPLEMYQDWKRENPGLSMIIVAGMDWSDDDAPPDIVQGRAVIDCESELIRTWEFQAWGDRGYEPPDVSDYLASMDDLDDGEFRRLSALVQTDYRPDGSSLTAWEIVWWEGIDDAGDEFERVDILSLDGTETISYRNDGTRWVLDQRGWVTHGSGGSPRLPNEIEIVLPWLRQLPSLIDSQSDSLDTGDSVMLTEDFTFTAGGGIERFLDINIVNGDLDSVRLRERTPNGERVRPEIRILEVMRSGQLQAELFHVPALPDFPELPADDSHYEIPVEEWSQLELIQMDVGNDPVSESYRISWNEVEFELVVRPSRGGLDPMSVPDLIDEAWSTAASNYRFGSLIWVHRQFSGYPTDAVWDDGRFYYELSVDRDAMSSEHEWSLQQLVKLADALSVEPAPVNQEVASGQGGGGSFARGFSAAGR